MRTTFAAVEAALPHMHRRQWLLATLAGAMPWCSHAQGTPAWAPKGPVRILVPFAAGGTSDIIARLLGTPLAQALGQPVVVENRAGAGGNIGIAAVARATPDGQNLLLVSSSFVTNPALFGDKPAFDPIRQFAPISLLVTSPDVIVVPAQSPFRTLADLLAAAKAKPSALNFSSPGKGNGLHLSGELLWQMAGVQIQHVPYSGAAPAVQAALSKQVDCALVALPVATAHLEAGTLRALAVGSTQRWPGLPQIPTVAESGFAGYRSETMQSLYAPAGTPAAAVNRLQAELQHILSQPDVSKRLQEMGFRIVASSPGALAARVAEEVPRWKDVVRKAKIEAD